ncbi:SF0329 family protein [Clostridium aminobutyricum]|uniref:Uncharacterized protein n=1 Tax=Clostridium aminobutyricum TaxID=33953 RepID=A0A939D8D2_CLOAM|nr:hypothetical protein [Clostridium aminobutyricum]MBN7773299.1 hypothetical protein [Clostridium aminobutyricum]
MAWSKIKQNLESFLSPTLVGKVEYCATGYRYLPDKSGRCYITVDKMEVLNMSEGNAMLPWYKTEQEIKNNTDIQLPVNKEDLAMVRKDVGDLVPDERLEVITRERKKSVYAKDLMAAQTALCKSDFYSAATLFLSDSIENNLESKDMLLNIFALIDRRMGKKKILSIEEKMKLKHPIVQYFYDLRRTQYN